MARLSIVVPVYHNAPSLPELLAQFQAIARRNAEDVFEFLFVDDGSRDDSFSVLQRLATDDLRVRILKLSRNFGSNAAISAGLAHTTGDAVAVISADLQDPPELLDTMFQLWREGKKVVLAARESRDDPGMTALLANTFYALFRRFAISSMPPRGFDFFVIDRQVCDIVKGIQEANVYLMGLILWVGFEPAIVPYHRREREKRFGRSMWTFARKIKYFLDSFVAFSSTPIRAMSLLGMFFATGGIIYAAVIISLWLFAGIAVPGWSSLMVVLLVVSGIQMIMMGIHGEYLWRNLDETRKRPRYIIDRMINNSATPASSSDRRVA